MDDVSTAAIEADIALSGDRPYQCPECGSHNLIVSVMIAATLRQDEAGNVHTDLDHECDHDWDLQSSMWCNKCNHGDIAKLFVTKAFRP